MSERDWNINKGFGDVLTDLIIQVNEAARQGDLKLWFKSLRILYRNVAGHKKIDKKIMNNIDVHLRDVMKKLDSDDAVTEKMRAYQKVGLGKVSEVLDEVNVSLITEMHKAGLILPIYAKRAEFAALET